MTQLLNLTYEMTQLLKLTFYNDNLIYHLLIVLWSNFFQKKNCI